MIVGAKEIANGFQLTDALVSSNLATSKGEAKRAIEGGAVRLNEKQITDIATTLTPLDFTSDFALLRSGKKIALLIFKK